MEAIIFHPIGILHTPFEDAAQTPIQSIRSDAPGEVEVYPQYAQGLENIEEFSHIILFYVWHRAPPVVDLKVKPFLDDRPYGLFATRYPCRPNPLGFSVVRLERREGNRLFIRGVDMLNGTPLLDIKPYNPEFDVHPAERTGWYERRAHP